MKAQQDATNLSPSNEISQDRSDGTESAGSTSGGRDIDPVCLEEEEVNIPTFDASSEAGDDPHS